jgi:hypothetical protein
VAWTNGQELRQRASISHMLDVKPEDCDPDKHWRSLHLDEADGVAQHRELLRAEANRRDRRLGDD